MGKSARMLGSDLGLTAQEMNQLLKDQGFLEGVPGAYTVTEKGSQFVKETYFQRGSGGSSKYNVNWTQRTWDESIKNVLDTSLEKCQAAREAVEKARRVKCDAIKAERAINDTFHELRPDSFTVKKPNSGISVSKNNLTTAGIVVGSTALLAGIGYGIYKATSHIKKWWHTISVSKSAQKNEFSQKGDNEHGT